MKMQNKNFREELTNSLVWLLEHGAIRMGEMVEFVDFCMYDAAMRVSKGDKSCGAAILGISLRDLKSKLRQNFGTTEVGGLGYREKDKIFSHQQLRRGN
jgi:hypothetical protein